MSSEYRRVLQKGDLIVNPKTGRVIRIGSRTYLKLVKEGTLANVSYRDSNIMKSVPPETSGHMVEKMKKELDRELPPDTQVVKGRGKYKNKLVKRENKKMYSDEYYTEEEGETSYVKVHNRNNDSGSDTLDPIDDGELDFIFDFLEDLE